VSGPAELAIAAGIVVDAGLKATGLVALGWLGTAWPPGRSAAQRHAVWAAVFAVMPLLPLASWARGPERALDAPWVVGAWALGFIAASAPIAVGLWRLGRLRADAVPDGTLPGVWHSDAVRSPISWGVWRSVVVLPGAAVDWSDADRAAALAHERAHLARHDWLVHVATWGVCAVFWFNPLVWWARRALAQEAEHAADDAALAAGARPSDYATLLLSLAHPGPRSAALGVASSPVGDRVRAVLDARPRSRRRGPTAAVALALSLSMSTALGAWSAWSTPPAELTCTPGP
jgi:beta-lactamase regulating signal transducer with metallopeptidase domain